MEAVNQIIDAQTQTIKQTVIGVQNYSVSRKIEPRFNLEDEIGAEIVDRAKDIAKHELLNSLGDFVNFDLNPYEQYVTAKIYMPFVYDDVYCGMKKELEKTNAALRLSQKIVNEKNDLIGKYENTWWIKLTNWIKGRG